MQARHTPSVSATRSFEHLDRMSDHRGLASYPVGARRRKEHGYCTDDNARLLVVTLARVRHRVRPSTQPSRTQLRPRSPGRRWSKSQPDGPQRSLDRSVRHPRLLGAQPVGARHRGDPAHRPLDPAVGARGLRQRCPSAFALAAGDGVRGARRRRCAGTRPAPPHRQGVARRRPRRDRHDLEPATGRGPSRASPTPTPRSPKR